MSDLEDKRLHFKKIKGRIGVFQKSPSGCQDMIFIIDTKRKTLTSRVDPGYDVSISFEEFWQIADKIEELL